MGTDYHPRNKKIEVFYCNSSGNDLLGQLHESFGLPVSESDPAWKHFGRSAPFRVPYKAKAADCRMWGAALEVIPDEKFVKHIEEHPHGWDRTVANWRDDFVDWVRKWQRFLKTCSGYTAI